MTEHPGGQFDNFANTPPTFLTLELRSVGGIMVSIAAFQAVDPGSIPGRRNIFSTSGRHQQEKNTILTFPKIYSIPGVQKGFPTPGIEPGPPG